MEPMNSLSNRSTPDRRGAIQALLALATLLLALGLAPRPTASAGPSAPRTVILVRHAEKGTDDAKDPSLSEAGTRRAEVLARLLARARPTRLVASEFKRTQATLAPLGKALGLELSIVPAGKPEALLAELRAAEPGSTWVVAGHSNTLPALAQGLGLTLPDLKSTPQGPMLGDDEYDRVFVLTLPGADSGCAPALLELRYGD
jgi:phosphohistidine phosphatase SixA